MLREVVAAARVLTDNELGELSLDEHAPNPGQARTSKLAVGSTPRQMARAQAGLSNKMKCKITTNSRPTDWPKSVPESGPDV